jgi:hypothetical protein
MQHARWCLLALLALPFACAEGACDASSCGAGFACLSDGACHPQGGLRDPCESDLECSPGLLCLASGTGTEARFSCARSTGAPGEPCGTAAANAVLACATGSRCVYRWSYALASFEADEVRSSVYWGDTREGFLAGQRPLEDICVADASLQAGEQCNNDSDCAEGLICHQGFTPNQCQPRSGDGQPCSFSSDCSSDYCELPRQDDGSYDPDWQSCVLADPGCDIRLDPSCEGWRSCRVCRPLGDLTGPPATDAGAPDAGAPDASAPDASTPDAGARDATP